MGSDERAPADSLIARLIARPQGFNLFQAISILERTKPQSPRVGRGYREAEAVRLSALVSLGFQPSDVAQVADGAATGEHYTLKTPVMSLAGANGPLPMPFTELLLERRAQRDFATQDFLDIFNHRFLAFFYRGRKKHHVGLNWDSHAASSLATCLDRLSALGLATGARSPHGETEWLRHAGLMGGAPRSMTGLAALLSDRFGLPVKGRQFRGGWQGLDAGEWSRLGARGVHAPRLGRNAVLGRRAWHQGAGVQLEIAQLTPARLDAFLPKGRDHELAHWLTQRYMQQDVQVELALTPQRPDAMRAQLARGARLGWTSWLAPGAHTTELPAARVKLGAATA
ncbi:MAG TPA: type VI secretion system baseplate subunit TssG [Ramlibacter sp.]|uniref:type VI secretion system baseplate subunit TssG n=1 Tax=Ramlibacter sp. TaxID=1917967 RepID=UPI002BCFB37B|nr:type VI secretion system baseplate subunit TssG [Ramlibacter sp.]HVZ43830.1 type VI secretion system baseplate subunit TssG [Ramlibacter sp.]